MAAKKKKSGSTREFVPGVISTIVDTISRPKGASRDEIVAVLVKAFPDRDPGGMTRTTMIQANRHATSKEKDDKRGGVIYFRRGRGVSK